MCYEWSEVVSLKYRLPSLQLKPFNKIGKILEFILEWNLQNKKRNIFNKDWNICQNGINKKLYSSTFKYQREDYFLIDKDKFCHFWAEWSKRFNWKMKATPNDEMKLRVKNLNVEINLHFTNRKRNSNGGLATLLHVSTSKEYK